MANPGSARNSTNIASPVAAVQVFDQLFSLVQSPPCSGATWWDVEIYGYGDETSVAPASSGAPVADGTLKSAQRNVPLRARIAWEGHEVDFDIGAGMRIAVYAKNVNLSAIGPAGSIEIRSPNDLGITNTNGPGGGNIIQQNSYILGQISSTENPIGDRVAKLTEVVNTEAAAVNVDIPASARKVQIFQDGVIAAAPVFFQTGTLSTINIGQIDFRGVVQPNSTDIMLIPGRATQIACPTAARTLTFVWQLEL